MRNYKIAVGKAVVSKVNNLYGVVFKVFNLEVSNQTVDCSPSDTVFIAICTNTVDLVGTVYDQGRRSIGEDILTQVETNYIFLKGYA